MGKLAKVQGHGRVMNPTPAFDITIFMKHRNFSKECVFFC